jgi:hypothetical protein
MSSKLYKTAIILALITAASVKAVDLQSAATPFQATVIGKAINVYPRPSAKEYSCAKVSSPDKVTVISVMGNWAKIDPPKGSFSWISKDYVKKDPSGLNMAMVTGNSVRVYAGGYDKGAELSPLHSPKQQTSLNEGEPIVLLGIEKEGYYKIIPPIGAYLWISTTDIKYLNIIKTTPIKPSEFKPIALPDTEPVKTITKTPAKTDTVTGPPIKIEEKPIVAPTPIKRTPAPTTKQAQKLKECYAIMDSIEAEKQKPVDQQDYSDIVKQIKPLMEDKTAGKAQRYAEYQMGMVKRFMLAGTAGKELKAQEETLTARLQKIQDKYDKKASIVPLSARYTISGTLRKSQIYTATHSQQRFLVIDKSGKIISYALPANDYIKETALAMVNKKVGIKGLITKDPDNSVTVINFTEIEDITEE